MPQNLSPAQAERNPTPRRDSFSTSLRGLGIDLPQGYGAPPQTPKGIRDFSSGFFDPIGAAMGEDELSTAKGIGGILGTGILPMAGVTKFLKTLAGGRRVPDVIARMLATEKNLDGMIGAGVDAGARSDDIEKAIRFAQRYPRTSAHQSVVHNPDIGKDLAGVNRVSPDGQRIRVEMGPMDNLRRGDPMNDRMEFAQGSLQRRANRAGLPEQKVESQGIFPFAHTLAHETQHTGQRLLNPSRKGLPPMLGNGLDWYHPMEEAARAGASRRIYGNKPRLK